MVLVLVLVPVVQVTDHRWNTDKVFATIRSFYVTLVILVSPLIVDRTTVLWSVTFVRAEKGPADFRTCPSSFNGWFDDSWTTRPGRDGVVAEMDFGERLWRTDPVRMTWIQKDQEG